MLRLLCSIAALAAARKTYLVKTEQNLKTMPRVRDYDWQKCLKETEDDFFCVDIDINWEIGWEWYQEQVEDNMYRLRLELYSKQLFIGHPEYSYPRFIYNEQTYTLQEWKFIFATEMVYHYPVDYLCVNIYRKTEEMYWEMLMIMKLMECLKVIVNCLYDRSNWTGEDAKYFEGCTQSSKEDVTLYDYTREEKLNYIMGADDATTVLGTSCSPKDGFWPLFPKTDEATNTAQYQIFLNFFNYLSTFHGAGTIHQL